MAPQILSPQDDAHLAQLLRHVLGTASIVVSCRVALRREDYAVLIVRLARPSTQVVVKLAGPRASIAAPFDRTAAILRLVRDRTAVPTVDVLAADVSYRRWPWRYLITTYAPGRLWSVVRPRLTTEDARAAYRTLGQAVAELHTLHFPAFGEIASDAAIRGTILYLPALAARAKRRIADPRRLEQFVTLMEERAEDFGDVGQAALCHEDLNPGNIVLHRRGGQWSVSAIIDFDSAWAGNAESDLARLELWRGMVGGEFWKGYESIGNLATTYPSRRLVLQLLWCLEYASPTPQHTVDTQRVCAELGIPPIRFS